jgi:nicotinamidase/pyrazinamidase
MITLAELTKDHTASFDVDAENGFTPICPNELPVQDGDKIVDELNEQATFAKFRIGSKDAHPETALHIATAEAPQFTPVGLPNIDIKWNRHCIIGTHGAELLAGLPHWSEYDYFVWKGMEPDTHPYGACFHDLADKISTGVIEYLRLNGVRNVIVGGLATDFCVKTTAIQLRKAGFKVIVNLGACRGIAAPVSEGKTTMDLAMDEMKNLGILFVNKAKEI